MILSMEGFKMRICPHCHAALMYEHPENTLYEKCVLCGYCQKYENAVQNEQNSLPTPPPQK